MLHTYRTGVSVLGKPGTQLLSLWEIELYYVYLKEIVQFISPFTLPSWVTSWKIGQQHRWPLDMNTGDCLTLNQTWSDQGMVFHVTCHLKHFKWRCCMPHTVSGNLCLPGTCFTSDYGPSSKVWMISASRICPRPAAGLETVTCSTFGRAFLLYLSLDWCTTSFSKSPNNDGKTGTTF